MDMNALLFELERDEGLRLKPYKDSVGKLTIGAGRNLDDVGISEEEARHLLENDVARTVADLDRHLPWWSGLDPVRQRVVINMAFNMGVAGLLGFSKTLAAMKSGDYVGAAYGMLASKWAGQVGERATRLAHMMSTGGIA